MDIQQYSQTTFHRCYLQKKNGQVWIVYDENQLIDVVWFASNATKQQVREALIFTDGYPITIDVRKTM